MLRPADLRNTAVDPASLVIRDRRNTTTGAAYCGEEFPSGTVRRVNDEDVVEELRECGAARM